MTSEYDLKQSLDHYTTGHVMLLSYSAESVAFVGADVNTTNNTIALTGATFVIGTRVRISGLSDFNPSQIYFSLSASSPYQFSQTLGGSAVDITLAAAGTVTDAEPVETGETGSTKQIQTVADAVRYELASYQGVTNRPAITYGAVSISGDKAVLNYSGNEITLNNSSGGSDLSFGYAVLIKGGSATPANTTGNVQAAIKYSAVQTVATGESKKMQFQITAEAA